MKKLLNMLNLTRQEWNWVLYDVGNSAFILLVTAIVPIYFGSLTAAAGLTEDQRFAFWGYGLSVATIVVALIGPIRGTLAAHRGYAGPRGVRGLRSLCGHERGGRQRPQRRHPGRPPGL